MVFMVVDGEVRERKLTRFGVGKLWNEDLISLLIPLYRGRVESEKSQNGREVIGIAAQLVSTATRCHEH
jgi:hypothetical protein